MKKTVFLVVLIFIAGLSFGQSNFTKGEELFMQNKPAEAIAFLEKAIAEDPAHVTAWVYLGIVYEQLGRADEAIATYRRVLPTAGKLSANVANNLGNVYFQKGDIEMAEQYYSQAISFDSVYARAYLGRANARIKSGNNRTAIMDYEHYLTLEPRSSQRARIEQMIALLREEMAAEERKKVLAAEEEKRRIEERQKLLDSVSASLKSVADSSRGISSGAESVEGYHGEFELE